MHLSVASSIRYLGTPVVVIGTLNEDVRVKNKLAHAALSTDSKAMPRIAEFPIQLEARVVMADKFGNEFKPLNLCAFAFESEIKRVHVEAHLTVDGHPNRINAHTWKPLIMNFRKFFVWVMRYAHPDYPKNQKRFIRRGNKLQRPSRP